MWFNVIIVLFQVIFFQLVWFPLSCNLKYSIFGFKLWCVLVWNTKIELTMEHEKMESTKKQKQIKHIICISTNKLFHYIFNRITARCALTTFKIAAHSLKIANIRGKHITVCCIFRSTQYKHERFEPNCRMPRRGKVLTKVLWMIANQQTRRNVD